MKKRYTLDSKGSPIAEIRTPDGMYEREFDTVAVQKLKGDALSIADTGSQSIARDPAAHPKVGSNPYQGGTCTDSKRLRKRSGLDYLRSLSVEISKRRDE